MQIIIMHCLEAGLNSTSSEGREWELGAGVVAAMAPTSFFLGQGNKQGKECI